MLEYDAILISGGSGAVGSFFLRELASRFVGPIYGLHRTPNAFERMTASLNGGIERVTPVLVDLADADASRAAAGHLPRHSRLLGIHCAGDVSWTKSERLVGPINVGGTRNFVAMATALSETPPSIVFLSTAFASADHTPRNAYERTKLQAEEVLRTEFAGAIRAAVVKCSLVVGAQNDGWISRFNGLYPLLRVILSAELPCLIADPSYTVDTVPTDFVWAEVLAAAAALSAERSWLDLVAASGPASLSLQQIVEIARERADRLRREAGLDPLPPLSIITERQYRFLMQASKSWDMEARFAKVEQISEIMSGYITHGGSGRTIEPLTLSGSAPPPARYLATATDFWIAQNMDRVVTRRRPEWLEPESQPA